jgi:hypothetical protein
LQQKKQKQINYAEKNDALLWADFIADGQFMQPERRDTGRRACESENDDNDGCQPGNAISTERAGLFRND